MFIDSYLLILDYMEVNIFSKYLIINLFGLKYKGIDHE